jgi:hypothetical protein
MAVAGGKTPRSRQRRPRKSNPAAKALGTPAYRPRVVQSKKAYTRKRERPEPPER